MSAACGLASDCIAELVQAFMECAGLNVGLNLVAFFRRCFSIVRLSRI
jgi:hypothetical protein